MCVPEPPRAPPQVLHCNVPPGHKSELVVDPGPGVLLVVSGSGKAMVRASCVSDALVLEETDLKPGEGQGWWLAVAAVTAMDAAILALPGNAAAPLEAYNVCQVCLYSTCNLSADTNATVLALLLLLHMSAALLLPVQALPCSCLLGRH